MFWNFFFIVVGWCNDGFLNFNGFLWSLLILLINVIIVVDFSDYSVVVAAAAANFLWMSSGWVIDLETSECMSGANSLYSAFKIIYNAYQPLVVLILGLASLFTRWSLLVLIHHFINELAKLRLIEKISKPAKLLVLCSFCWSLGYAGEQ